MVHLYISLHQLQLPIAVTFLYDMRLFQCIYSQSAFKAAKCSVSSKSTSVLYCRLYSKGTEELQIYGSYGVPLRIVCARTAKVEPDASTSFGWSYRYTFLFRIVCPTRLVLRKSLIRWINHEYNYLIICSHRAIWPNHPIRIMWLRSPYDELYPERLYSNMYH